MSRRWQWRATTPGRERSVCNRHSLQCTSSQSVFWCIPVTEYITYDAHIHIMHLVYRALGIFSDANQKWFFYENPLFASPEGMQTGHFRWMNFHVIKFEESSWTIIQSKFQCHSMHKRIFSLISFLYNSAHCYLNLSACKEIKGDSKSQIQTSLQNVLIMA